MIAVVFSHILRFVLLILLQALVLDHMDLAGGYMIPYLYILFLLMLPIELPTWALLLIGFVTGALMDMLASTPGMHTSACLVLAFLRPFILKVLAPRGGYEFGQQPTVQSMGLVWFLTYASILILAHHLWLFYVEVFRWDRFFGTLLRVFLSGILTLFLSVLVQYMTMRGSKN